MFGEFYSLRRVTERYGTLRNYLDNIILCGTIRFDKVSGLLLHRSYLPSTPRRSPPTCGEGFLQIPSFFYFAAHIGRQQNAIDHLCTGGFVPSHRPVNGVTCYT